jgi:amidase
MLPVADGSDMMGSLRNPGAFNNVIGYRPSTDVMSNSNASNRGLSTSGPMGRNTADTIQLLKTIAVKALPGEVLAADLGQTRIGWLGNLNGYFAMEDGVLELCESSLNFVVDAGAKVEQVTPQFAMADLWECWTTLRHSGRSGMLRYYNDPKIRTMLKPEMIWEIEQSLVLTDDDRASANVIRQNWYRELDRMFGEFDFLALPTAQVFPYPKIQHWPTEINGKQMDTYHRWMEIVILGSLGGLPIVNVPVGFDEQGRPMGMQIMGRFGADKKVLEFALAYEKITDYLQRPPNLIPA